MLGTAPPPPLLRGWSHAVAVVPAAVGATVLVLQSPRHATERAALVLYGVSLTLLFGVSALYHRGPWSPRVRAIWRRADHATIFLMIAATYTAIGVIVLHGAALAAILAAVWVAAITGMIVALLPVRVPRGVTVLLYMLTGWIAIVVLPVLVGAVGAGDLALLVGGGVLYSLGALAYATRRPRLWPSVFGFHEVFHLLVIAASALFFAFVALIALQGARP